MAIPPLLPSGLLPPGLHLASLEEVRGQFGRGNDRRRELFEKLDRFLALARTFEIFRNVFLDGSFVTDKAAPGDVDAVLEMDKADLPRLLAHPNRLAILDARKVRSEYEIHLFLDTRMVTFFQRLRPEEAIVRNLDPTAERGILKVAL